MAIRSGWLTELVDDVERSSAEKTDHFMRLGGMASPPTTHLLSKHARQAYLGCVSIRPFYRGTDAAAAVTTLGLLPSVATATHLVVVWEYAALNVALQSAGDPFPSGLVVLDASLDGHTVRWNPFLMHVGPGRGDGLTTVLPEWGTPVHYPDGWLPDPRRGRWPSNG
ncbi:MAG: hypothetical protein QOG20_3694 [Pseudonocardiales bacterium]|jgi:hypothetical protein|nr:hypothetical protein [Pseudonocardiales bacterium]